MTDYEAEKAINSLIRLYTAEQRKRDAPDLDLSGPAELAFERVKVVCELRLGREKLQSGTENKEPFDSNLEPIALKDLIACLKRIRRSIQKWNRDTAVAAIMILSANSSVNPQTKSLNPASSSSCHSIMRFR